MEHNVAIQIRSENNTANVAEGTVRYDTHNACDVWRRLFQHYASLANDLQNLLTQELYDLKSVAEPNIDQLLNDRQRIAEWYIRSGPEAMAEKWLVVAMQMGLLTKVSVGLCMELRKLSSVDERRNAINIYRHDHGIGLRRGVSSAVLAMIESPPDEDDPGNNTNNGTSNNDDDAHKTINKNIIKDDDEAEDPCAVPNGRKGKIGRGYGQCRECGDWGHTRRQCPKFAAW